MTLESRNGRKDVVKNFRVYSDSTYIERIILENVYFMKNKKVPTTSLKQISNKRQGRGAAKGFLYRLFFGTVYAYGTIFSAEKGKEGAAVSVGSAIFLGYSCLIGAIMEELREIPKLFIIRGP